MPRGFLVKRNRRSSASYRLRNNPKPETCNKDGHHREEVEVTTPQNVWCVPGTDALLPVSCEASTEAWNLNVESALEAEADRRRAHLPYNEEHRRDIDVLTPECDFSCFFPPPPLQGSPLMDACSPVKPVGARLPEQHECERSQPLFTDTPFPASIERLFASKDSAMVTGERLNRHNRTSAGNPCKKPKTNRKLNFEDEVTTSPVLGLRIKKESPEVRKQHRHKSAAPNGSQPLGEFICQLCKEEYSDPLSLAQHRCSRIVRVEYRCPECDKVFSCPANLASHRRWHKPRPANNPAGERSAKEFKVDGKENELLCVADGNSPAQPDSSPPFNQGESPPPGLLMLNANPYGPSLPPAPPPFAPVVAEEEAYDCRYCGKKFRRQAYLKKHVAAAHEMTARAPSPYQQSRQVCACQLCGARFPSADIRDKHRVWHTVTGELLGGGLRADVYGGSREQQILTCKYCPSTFLSSPQLTRHISKAHPGENLHVMMHMAVRN
ncbi:insulinoma-associated protein 2 [Nerophis ophidion]|uniref:insulinoma-associated protein 2 n=1 Tax=Nerophis ophidion TaxID=159077 RepID=UPI002ADFB68D|nr:insulinoma-associated protein 2 [Nerophis ophidion]